MFLMHSYKICKEVNCKRKNYIWPSDIVGASPQSPSWVMSRHLSVFIFRMNEEVNLLRNISCNEQTPLDVIGGHDGPGQSTIVKLYIFIIGHFS